MNKSRSIKLASLESSRLSKRRGKIHYQAYPFNSESKIYCNADQNRRKSFDLIPYLASSGSTSLRVVRRRLSLKPVRILTKMATFKTKKPFMGKCPKTSQFSDSNILKGTCSSTLKDSKFPGKIDIQLGGSASEKVTDMKVCPYTYCSLHGHRHGDLPPLRRFVSMRRRVPKTQKSIKMESPSVLKSNQSRNNKRTQTSLSLHKRDPADSEKAHDSRAISPEVKRGSTGNAETTSDADDQENSDFAYFTEVLLGETSYPDMSLKGPLNQIQDSLTAEENTPVKFLATNTTSWECCCITTEFDTPISEVTGTAKNNGKIVASSGDCENVSAVLIDDQPPLMDSHLPQLEEPGQTDDCVVTSNEKAGEDDSVLQLEENECPKLASCHNDLESENRSLDKSEAPGSDVYVGTTTGNTMIFSISGGQPQEEQTGSKDDKNGHLEHDCGLLQSSPPHQESKPACTADVACNKKSKKNLKYFRMWHLMYKHAVSGVTEQSGKKFPFDVVHKEERVQETQMSIGVDTLGSCQDCSEIHQNMLMKKDGMGQRKIEQCKIEAVKVVQEAFDEILFPQIQVHSLNDPSLTRGIGPKQEPLEKSNVEVAKGSISCAMNFVKEESLFEADNVRGCREEKAEVKVENRSNRMPGGWSNLKKLILFKRFVKALEKVRNINPRKPKYLPSNPDPEAEKVYLRHQTTEERKNAEEWMLDYALQHVISKLAPIQKQKVQLLVEAFETVLPLPEIETSPRSQEAVATQANTVQALNGHFSRSEEETGKTKDYGNSTQVLIGDHADYVCGSLTAEHHNPEEISELKVLSLDQCHTDTESSIPASEATDEDWREGQSLASNLDQKENNFVLSVNVCLQDIKDPRSCDNSSFRQDDKVSSCYEKTPVNLKVQNVPKELNLNLEPSNSNSESNGRKCDNKSLISANGEQLRTLKSSILKSFVRTMGANSAISSAATCQPLEEPTAAIKERVEKKNNRLWYFVYKHMASGIAEKDGAGPFLDRTEEEEPESSANTKPGTKVLISPKSLSTIDYDNHMDPQLGLHHIEAIKLVEEAIDAILPDDHDQSHDDQSIKDNITPDHKFLPKKLGGGGELLISKFTDSDKDCFSYSNITEREYSPEQEQGEKCQRFDNESTQAEEPVMELGNKLSQQLPRSWSNLKKVILLKRFIKALEKVGNFNLRGPKYLPLERDAEPEKAHLRHQDMEQRKDAQEWMLDYALQQVVAKLTPTRRRKVGLLVEAFETVIPTIKN
ncbi:Calmodulin-binding domain [Quillaja saponaria]|uniref:Calmodulin-binding domain n=1 Tax=Quillaja saponaria TaxID=32244 RepID=A0AAD7Q876_QUISA|nr:Calmodulin-binding domain [Quillaja saponaria]